MHALTRRTAMLGAMAAVAAPPIRLAPGAPACLVPVELDGKQATLLLDTGAERTILSRAAVLRLGLRRDRWVSTTLRGAGGLLDRRANADVRVARAGGAELFSGMPGKMLSLPVTSAAFPGADGLLGGDLLRHLTVDLDMPRGTLVLRPPPEPAPAGRAEAGKAAAVPLQLFERCLPLARVRLDGHELTALIDTGASGTILNARGLYRMGLIGALPEAPPPVTLRGIGGESPATPRRFKELRIGTVAWQSPTLLTETVPEAAFDLILGMDLLRQQRVVLSYPALTLAFA
jgi:predicted aspartyl protease